MTTATAPPKAPAGPRRRPRNVRTSEVIGWFVGVFCTYWIYWLIAVPLIEPGIEPQSVGHLAGAADPGEPQPSLRKQALAQYFPPGSWELNNPQIWETDQSMLLFKDPESQPDNVVKIEHCTLLFFPREGASAAVEPRPIIMRAEHGASLKFDRPINLKTVGRDVTLIGGQLHGRIRIERLPSRPGAGDDLLITTRDVVLNGDRATSPHPVNFRMGRSQGSGRDLEIQLQNDGKPGGAFRTGKIRALFLKRDVIMNLALDDPAFARDRRPGAAGDLSGSTLRVTCQGHFQYDFEMHAASFHDRVDVARMSKGPSDLLNCELLSIFFRSREDSPPEAAAAPQAATASAPPADSPIRRIEARGEPVTLQSPSRGIYVQSLGGLDFEPIPGDPLGRIQGLGQGVMQGIAPGEQGNKFLVRWTREFRFEPTEGGQYVASLHGGASVRMPNFGEITANDRLDAQGKLLQEGELFAWATPVKAAPPAEQVAVRPVSLQAGGSTAADVRPQSDRWQIDRLLAQGSVIVSTPQLDANTGKIEVWVERPTAATAAPAAGAPANVAVQSPPEKSKPQLAPGAIPGQRYSVRAGNVQVKLIPNGEEFAVASLTLENQAHLEELTAKPGVKPMVVSGDRLHVTNADSEQTRVTVAANPGSPLAHIDAGGMMLFGQAIELEKHTNRLWVDGAGQMVMPITQDLNGQPLAQPQSAEITWQGGMRFQSNTVVFERDVRIKSDHQLLTTPILEGVLDRPIDFSNPRLAAPAGGPAAAQDTAQLAIARCRGESKLEGRQLDEKEQQTAVYEMKLFDLEIHRQSGAVKGRGPGTIHYVALAPEGAGGAGFALPGQPRPDPGAMRPKLPYTCIDTRFDRELTGNINQRTMTFSTATKTAYAPVNHWHARLDADNPASLGAEGIVLDANQLTVRQMPPRVRGEQGWFELVAEKNVVVEGATFVAAGHRATYSQDKDNLILEGDGLSPALLNYIPVPGGTRSTTKVQKLTYSLSKQHVQITGTTPINIEAPRGGAPPQARQ